MRRRISVSLLLLGASCAAARTAPEAARPTPSLLDPPAAAAAPATEPEPAPEPIDDSAFERQQRERLQGDADPEPAALAFAGWLCAAERLPDALAALEQALQRRPHSRPLRLGRAAVLRDLGRRHLAVQALREIDAGDVAGDPQLLFDLAWLEWLEGQRAAAAATLQRLRAGHAASPLLRQLAPLVAVLADELANAERPQRLPPRDLLGNLRGAPEPEQRLYALRQLLQAGDELRARAVAIAVQDGAPLVRAAGVGAAALPREPLAELLQLALYDDSATVRSAAAVRAASLPPAAAVPLLLAALEREQEPIAFATLQQSLDELLPDGPRLPAGGADSAAQRAAVAAAWRQRWQ